MRERKKESIWSHFTALELLHHLISEWCLESSEPSQVSFLVSFAIDKNERPDDVAQLSPHETVNYEELENDKILMEKD